MDGLLITVHNWMTSGGWPAMVGCFAWGVVSVALSPCHLASIPLIVTYVAGQEKAVSPRLAMVYSLLFTLGLFITIAAVGVVCSWLGMMLGDIGPYWSIPVGLILLWVALDMLGVASMSMSGGLMARLKFRGRAGALLLGLAYGVLSGSCTFGFIAPILAIITAQQDLAGGSVLILLFGLGHALPIAIAGSSTALVGGLLENKAFQRGSFWFRKAAGAGIAALGLYFLASPFFSA